jgi:hypothetical protein
MSKYRIAIVSVFMALSCSEVDNCNFYLINSKSRYCVNANDVTFQQLENGRFIFFNGNNG